MKRNRELYITIYGHFTSDDINYNLLNAQNLYNTLRLKPHLYIYCNWSKFNAYKWCELLTKQPQLDRYCDWSKLNNWYWFYLLESQPQFERYRKR